MRRKGDQNMILWKFEDRQNRSLMKERILIINGICLCLKDAKLNDFSCDMEDVVFSLRSGDVRYSYSHFHGSALPLSRHVHEAADAGRYDVISAPETCDMHKVLRRHIRPKYHDMPKVAIMPIPP